MTAKIFSVSVSYFAMYVAQIGFFAKISELRYDKKKIITFCSIFLALLFVLMIVSDLWSRGNFIYLERFYGVVPMFVFLVFISKYKGIKFLATFFISYISMSIMNFMMYMVVLAFGMSDEYRWIVRVVFMVLWWLLLTYFVGDSWKKALNTLENGWSAMFVAAFTIFGLVYILSFYPTDIKERTEDMPFAFGMSIVMLCVVIMGMRMVNSMLKVQERSTQVVELEKQYNMAEKQYQLMSGSVSEIRRLKHDMKYHLSIMYGLLNSEKYEDAMNYMKEYQTELAVLDGELPVYTKNTAVNILTSYYISVAKENGIETTVSINIPEQLSIDRVDLTAILGNMWKNALDACRSLSVDVRKYIDTSIRVENGMLLIKCVNSSPETVKDKSGNFLSTKGKDHGNGLAIIEDTVERYGGFWKADYKDGAFTLTAAVRVQGKN